MELFKKDKQYIRFCLYGFLKNLRFYDAFILLFFLDNGLSYSQIGVLYASREIAVNVSEIPTGLIADMYGRKSSLIGGFLLYIIASLSFYFSDSFTLLLVAMLLMGLADALRSGTHKGMIMDYLRINNWSEQKIAYYGHTRSWSLKGSAVSALIAGLVVFYTGLYRYIFLISVIPYLINLVNISTYPQELNFSQRDKTRASNDISTFLKTILNTLRKRRVLEIVNSSALHSAYLKSIKDYIQPVIISLSIALPVAMTMDAKSKGALLVGIIYSIIFLLTSYASKMAGRFSSLGIKDIEKRTLFVGLFSGVLCGFLIYQELWLAALLVFVIVYLIENLRKPILTGYLVDNVPNDILTSVISTQSFYNAIATAVLSVLIGIFADAYGIGTSIGLVSVCLLLFTFSVQLLGKRFRESKLT